MKAMIQQTAHQTATAVLELQSHDVASVFNEMYCGGKTQYMLWYQGQPAAAEAFMCALQFLDTTEMIPTLSTEF